MNAQPVVPILDACAETPWGDVIGWILITGLDCDTCGKPAKWYGGIDGTTLACELCRRKAEAK
jgi:hypothetical protein